MMLTVLRARFNSIPALLRRSQPGISVLFTARWFSDDDDSPKQRVSKVKKKEKNPKGNAGGGSRDLDLLVACLDAPKLKPPPPDEQELARRQEILKNYTIGIFRKHNQENHEISVKLKLKKHAIKMLPKNSKLREKALEVDDLMPPRWRKMPAWTPPIPGFNPSGFMIQEE
jgi:hypothetical protein